MSWGNHTHNDTYAHVVLLAEVTRNARERQSMHLIRGLRTKPNPKHPGPLNSSARAPGVARFTRYLRYVGRCAGRWYHEGVYIYIYIVICAGRPALPFRLGWVAVVGLSLSRIRGGCRLGSLPSHLGQPYQGMSHHTLNTRWRFSVFE